MPDLGPLAVNLTVTLALVLLLTLTTFWVALRRNRYDTVDTAWGLGFAVVALTGLALSTGHGNQPVRLLVTTLTVIWGLRLATHLHRRNRHRPEDPRYAAITIMATARPHPKWFLLTRVYLVQAAYLWLVSLPVQFTQYLGGEPTLLHWLGTTLWLLGFTLETLADHQLTQFRANPANHGKVLDQGLWRYTRHPNYFGDACLWWGLYLLACDTWLGATTILAPLLMTFLLARGIGGKPMLERHLHLHRPAYAAYTRRTSGFFPRPPGKSGNQPGLPDKPGGNQ
ncbi:DUF1295 domain-containing protein [Crossiella cryophila]|uniref:Steroid 5-alpha reductase family enzyme n=1 Tax=Crossiella cryophila TaxID=43355 RepID=A0A7W7CCF8_9PSEU|nr:DUF1295 domain-containing protein [Crossiella cryophila]MBB4678612.1 steroid 5-alpha reductase family enzyme [Crossiella cryophila]